MTDKPLPEDDVSPEEGDRRRDEIVKRMLATPPKPHKPKGEKEPKRDDREGD